MNENPPLTGLAQRLFERAAAVFIDELASLTPETRNKMVEHEAEAAENKQPGRIEVRVRACWEMSLLVAQIAARIHAPAETEKPKPKPQAKVVQKPEQESKPTLQVEGEQNVG